MADRPTVPDSITLSFGDTADENKVRKIREAGDVSKWVNKQFCNGHQKSLLLHFLDYDVIETPELRKILKKHAEADRKTAESSRRGDDIKGENSKRSDNKRGNSRRCCGKSDWCLGVSTESGVDSETEADKKGLTSADVSAPGRRRAPEEGTGQRSRATAAQFQGETQRGGQRSSADSAQTASSGSRRSSSADSASARPSRRSDGGSSASDGEDPACPAHTSESRKDNARGDTRAGTDSSKIHQKCAKDIETLCTLKDGVLISWGGKETCEDDASKKTFVRLVLYKLCTSQCMSDFKDEFDGETRSVIVSLPSVCREKVSDHTHHILQPQKTPMANDMRETFIADMSKTARSAVVAEDKGDTTPTVCIFTGGGPESLSAAVTAVKRGFPLIVMEGGDVMTDLIALLYKTSTIQQERRRYHDGVRNITVRKPDKRLLKDILKKSNSRHVQSLEYLAQRLHLLSIYRPADTEARHLDAIILEALINNKKDSQIDSFLSDMLKKRSPEECLFGSEREQWDMFLASLRDGCLSSVKAFLGILQLGPHDFHFGRLITLYEAECCHLRSEKIPVDTRPKGQYRFLQARRDLHKYAGRSPVFPLLCQGVQCRNCHITPPEDSDGNRKRRISNPFKRLSRRGAPENRLVEVSQQDCQDFMLQTCLHPVQELFLWSLLFGNADIAAALWEYTQDRMAAALFAREVYHGIAKREGRHHQGDRSRHSQLNSLRFQQLALATLRVCQELSEEKVVGLLTKPCPWWGHVTVLDVAQHTQCRAFVATDACRKVQAELWVGRDAGKEHLASVFKGEETLHTDSQKNPLAKSTRFSLSPRSCYGLCTVWQAVFILLFSCVLLRGITGTSHPLCIVLIVWVADIAVEELRQMVCQDGRLSVSCRSYFRQKWNVLDVVSVALFVVGNVLAYCPHPSVHMAGRVALALDLVAFILRFLQVLVVLDELGLVLAIAMRMVKDTVWFMLILLLVTYAYAVSSESLLYKESGFNGWPDVYHLPRKAYWSMFGDLRLEEIEEGFAPWIVVPIFLGVYVIMTQVLLLNLLIARFSATHDRVEGEALMHQAWQRCQLVREFRNRSPLPPPCNLLFLWTLAQRRGRCCPKVHETAGEDQTPEHDQAQGAGEAMVDDDDEATEDSDSRGEDRLPLKRKPKECLTKTSDPRMHGLCVRATWAGSYKRCTVDINNTYSVNEEHREYPLKAGANTLIVWKTDPSHTVEFKFEDSKLEEFKLDNSSQMENFDYVRELTFEYYKALDRFETEQTHSARVVDQVKHTT